MFVRKVRTASGAVAVQVMRKAGRRDEVIEHIGSAHTDAELGVLLERARRLATGDQDVLDFEVPARTERVSDVADWRAGELIPAAAGLKGAPAPPGRTTATSSRLLYDVVSTVYDWLGFDVVDDAVFRDLVIARIVEPTSKADAARVLADLGAETVSYKTIQRHLTKVNTGKYRDVIAAKCLAHAADRGGLSLLLYDVTTLYFEAESEDDLRKVGYSKERRVDPQIVVGLLVDRTGFPLEIGCFEGNTAETTTLVPIITAFANRHGLSDTPMVVAADAGMLSASNLTALDEARLGFIVGSRTVKAPIDLASHFHWNGDVFTDSQIIDTVTPRHANSTVNNVAHRAEPVWNPEEHPGAWRAIWQYSAKRARRDQQTLHAQEARAKAVINGERAAKSTRFVKVTAGARTLDEAGLARAQSLVGLKGCHQPRRRRHGRHRGDRQVPRPLARREGISDVQDRPTGPANVPPHPRRHRSASDHRVHRTRGRPLHSRTHRTGHCQRPQTTTAPALGDHRHQRRHPDLPTRNPGTPTKNPRQPRPKHGLLSQMS